MAVTLDPPVFRQGLAVAALSTVSLWRIDHAGGAALAGSKEPLAVLLHDGTSLRAFDTAGHPMSAARVEVLHPGAARTLAALWQEHRDGAFSGDTG